MVMQTFQQATAYMRAPFRNWLRRKIDEVPWRVWRGGTARRGSAEWLIRSEIRYGGFVADVPRTRVSPADPRTVKQLRDGGMTGGDRMLHHGYAETYARYLEPLIGKERITLAEFGILTGTGLAIWCDLFPQARVLGLDIDLQHFLVNRDELHRRGAFARNEPELHEYDQLVESPDRLADILHGQTLDIVVDDGLHTADAILTTWRSVRRHLSPSFVYFIEDHANLFDRHSAVFEGFDCQSFGMMSVVRERGSGILK